MVSEEDYFSLACFYIKELLYRMTDSKKWVDTPVRERMQIVNGTALIFSAIVLYFLAFIVTLTIQIQVVSAGATLLATGLAFFGITSFVKNQLIDFEATVNKRMKKLENEEKRKGTDSSDGIVDA